MMTTKPKSRWPGVCCLLLSAFCVLPVQVARAQDDVVLRAMWDELARSMQQLQLEKLEKPYFIAYRVQESTSAEALASFGGLVSSSSDHDRILNVEVRVGSPQLDNTNFFSMSFLNRGGLSGGFGGMAQLPLSDNYKEIRRQLWLATDSAYKKALEDLSRKRAALQNKTSTENIPDFSQQKPATITESETPVMIGLAQMETLARNLSAVFKGSQEIFTDSAHVTFQQTYTRYINSDGSSFTRADPSAHVGLTARTQADDGAPLRDSMGVYGRTLADLPSMEDLEARARTMGERLEKLRSAALLEHYNGPVLFEGQAAAELFKQVIAPALLAVRRPQSDAPQFEMFSSQMENPFQDRIGGRVLPDFLSVTDDPTLKDFDGKPLLGGSRVDDDGVPTQRTVLVENGTLKTLLASRVPVPGVPQSTGSRHGGGITPSNLLVIATQGLPDKEMTAKLLSLVEQRGKPYGIIVERLADSASSSDPLDMMESMMGGIMAGQGGEGPTQVALAAYKVFPDGHRELVRNVLIDGANTSAFKDIIAASDNPHVFNTTFFNIRNSGFFMFGGVGFGGAPAVVSLVVPSLLFDDVSMKQSIKELPKPPLSPRPVGGN